MVFEEFVGIIEMRDFDVRLLEENKFHSMKLVTIDERKFKYPSRRDEIL